MSTEHSDIEAMIAALEAKREALTQAIDALRAVIGAAGAGPIPGGGGPRGIRSDSFVGKTIPEATRLFLNMSGKTPQTIENIAEALRKGGVESKATNFAAMCQTILRRIENQTGEFFRISSGEWALPEWYNKKPTPKGTKDRESGEEATNTTEGDGKTSGTDTARAG